MPNGRKNFTGDAVQPTNTYQLRGRNVPPKYSQPPSTQQRDREYIKVTCGESVDKSKVKSTSVEGIGISGPSVHAARSNLHGYPYEDSQQIEGQRNGNCLSQLLHMKKYIQRQSDVNIVRSVLNAPQQRRTSSDEQEFGQPTLELSTASATVEPRISNRTVEVACRALERLMSIFPDSQNGSGSQTISVPPRPQLLSHTPAQAIDAGMVVCGSDMTQDLNTTLSQFRASFQQVFEFVQAPLNDLRDRVTGLEQELNQKRSETMHLGRCAAWTIIDMKNLMEAIAGMKAGSMAIETLAVEISKAA